MTKYIAGISLLALFSTRSQAQQPATPPPDASIISTSIDILAKLLNSNCSDTAPIKSAKANRIKGSLLKKYNRWHRRKRITQQQYESLSAELLGISVIEFRQIKMLYK